MATQPVLPATPLPIKAASGRISVPLSWDITTRRFVDKTGETVSRNQLRQWINGTLKASGLYLNAKTRQMLESAISHEDWAIASVRELKNLHTAFAVIANGGVEQMDQSTWGALGAKLKFELSHFRDFYNDAEAGVLSEDQVLARMDSYAAGGWKTFENSLRALEINTGDYDEEIRVLSTGLNCDDCLEAAGHWEELGSLPEISDSQCLNNCNCEFAYRNSKTGDEGE